jgi:hypothetical protein
MGVCFIGEKRGKFGEFVGRSLFSVQCGAKCWVELTPPLSSDRTGQYTTPEPTPGHLITPTGTILGLHAGLWHYTIGQRARIPGMKEKWFVASKRVGTNEVVVVPGADHPALCCRALRTSAKEFSWIAGVPPEGVDEERGVRARCQVRHRMRDVPVFVRRIGYVYIAHRDPTESTALSLSILTRTHVCLSHSVPNWRSGSKPRRREYLQAKW